MRVSGEEEGNSFEIRVSHDFIRLQIDEVWGYPEHTGGFGGGYSAHSYVDIQCGEYCVHGFLECSTADVWRFYTELAQAHHDLDGQALFEANEGSLSFTVTFIDRQGHINIKGVYEQTQMYKRRLEFEFEGDQSYLIEPLAQLGRFVAKYGDNRGVRGRTK